MTDQDRITRGRMGRIDQLDAEHREVLHKMVRAGKTQREILSTMNEVLAEHGEEPLSAAGLNRYINRASIREIADRSRIATQFGEAVGRAGDEDGGTKLDRGLVNFGQTLAMETMAALDQAELPDYQKLDALKVYSLITQRLNRANVWTDARERAIRAEGATAAAKEAKKRGVSDDAVAAIRAAVQGGGA